jgi:hypothetical protein
LDFRRFARITIIVGVVISLVPLALSIFATANLFSAWWEFITNPFTGIGMVVYLSIAIGLILVILILNMIVPLVGFFRIHYEVRERFAIIFLFIAIITFFLGYLFWELWLGHTLELLPMFYIAFAPISFFLMISLIVNGIVLILASILTILVQPNGQ